MGFVTPAGCNSVFAVLWFQTDIGIGFVATEVPRSGEFKYKCSTTMPVPAFSSASKAEMGAILNHASGNTTGTARAGLDIGDETNPTGTFTASERKTKLSSSPSTINVGKHSQFGVAQSTMVAKSRIDNIIVLLSKIRQDEEFAEAACRLMNCSHIDQLEIMAMNHLMAQLGEYP